MTRLLSIWNGLNPRERLLMGIVAAMVFGALGYAMFTSAMETLDNQLAAIDRLEVRLINYSRQFARQEPVDAAFSQISSQHSVAWTAEEIQDRLGSEIYRLARQNPGEPGSAGSGSFIVEIPSLPAGDLESFEGGYREYTLEFKTGRVHIDHLLTFLRRLAESPQALRIEAIDIQRPPESANQCVAVIRVKRTVVDGVVEDAFLDGAPTDQRSAPVLANASFEEQDEAGAFPGWLAPGCELEADRERATHAQQALRANAASEAGRIYQTLELEGGATYLMRLDVQADTPITLGVWDDDEKRLFDGAAQVEPGETPQRYRIAFTVPGDAPRQVRVPYIAFRDAGSVVLDHVAVIKRAQVK